MKKIFSGNTKEAVQKRINELLEKGWKLVLLTNNYSSNWIVVLAR